MHFITSWVSILVFFVLTLSLAIGLEYFYVSNIVDAQGNKVSILDFKPQNTVDNTIDVLESMGEKGRMLYRQMLCGIDLFYPLVYSIFLFLLIIKFSSSPKRISYKLVCFFPFIAGLLDIAENVGIASMLDSFSDISASQVSMVYAFTVSKWAFVSFSVIVMLWFGSFYFLKGIYKR